MSSARIDAKRSAWAEFLRGLSRERALIALFDRGTGFTLRAARLCAFGIFLSYALAILLARGSDRRALIQGFVQAALEALSWAVGALAALSAAHALAQPTQGDALAALARGRGYSVRSVLRARTLSVAVRIARWVGLPGVLLVLVGLSRGATLLWASAVAPALVVYASVLGLSLALLALFSAQLAPSKPRLMLLALALGPQLIAQAFPRFPSLIGSLSSLLAQLLDSGARLT